MEYPTMTYCTYELMLEVQAIGFNFVSLEYEVAF